MEAAVNELQIARQLRNDDAACRASDVLDVGGVPVPAVAFDADTALVCKRVKLCGIFPVTVKRKCSPSADVHVEVVWEDSPVAEGRAIISNAGKDHLRVIELSISKPIEGANNVDKCE